MRMVEGMVAPERIRRRAGSAKGERREAAILAATRELMRTRSAAEITVDELAAAAGISRTSFYFYFPSMDAVLTALMQEVQQTLDATIDWYRSTGPNYDALLEHTRNVALMREQNRGVIECSMAATHRYEALSDFMSSVRERFVVALEAKIVADRAAGIAPEGIPAGRLASLVLGLRDAHFARAADSADFEDGVRDLVDATLRLIYGSVPDGLLHPEA